MVQTADITVHLAQNWYSKKRPKLQFDILACLILRGTLTKGETENILKKRHGDVIKSFDILEKKNLIRRGERIVRKGRLQYKYSITMEGIKALINDNFTNPLNFWKIIYGFCNHYNKEGNAEQIDKYFDLFLQKYLYYSNCNYLYLQDIFNNISKLWFEEYPENQHGISSEQKILEVLAINSPLTIDHLVNKTNLDRDTINNILLKNTGEFFISEIRPSRKYHIFNNTTQTNKNKLYTLYFRHNLIKKIENENSNTQYTLTLFGVIFILKLIRYYNIEDKEKYYFNKLTFLDYFDKISTFYREKIPLIFGKWNILKDILKNYAIYNFDLILDPKDIFKENQLSVSLEGSKELYDGIKEIILQTRQQIGEFVNLEAQYNMEYIFDIDFSDMKNQNDDYLSQNTVAVGSKMFSNYIHLKFKINQIEKILNPLELGHTDFFDLNSINNPVNKPAYEIEIFEKMFAEEISAIYYFNLHNNKPFNFESHLGLAEKTYKQIMLIEPTKCLYQILIKDKDIRNFYVKWKSDLIKLNKKTFNNINNRFDSFQIF